MLVDSVDHCLALMLVRDGLEYVPEVELGESARDELLGEFSGDQIGPVVNFLTPVVARHGFVDDGLKDRLRRGAEQFLVKRVSLFISLLRKRQPAACGACMAVVAVPMWSSGACCSMAARKAWYGALACRIAFVSAYSSLSSLACLCAWVTCAVARALLVIGERLVVLDRDGEGAHALRRDAAGGELEADHEARRVDDDVVHPSRPELGEERRPERVGVAPAHSE